MTVLLKDILSILLKHKSGNFILRHGHDGSTSLADDTAGEHGGRASNYNTKGDDIAVYSFALKPEEHQPSELAICLVLIMPN